MKSYSMPKAEVKVKAMTFKFMFRLGIWRIDDYTRKNNFEFFSDYIV